MRLFTKSYAVAIAAIALLFAVPASAQRRVPKDLSILGFDDVSIAGLRRINLTTINQPREELVRLGIEALLGRIDGRITGEPRLRMAGVGLRKRGTTAHAPVIGTLQTA
jgi:DNA-binding LacI/PurR family transcriptional regulator